MEPNTEEVGGRSANNITKVANAGNIGGAVDGRARSTATKVARRATIVG